MKGEHPLLVADGGYGKWIQAFSYDLLKGEMWSRCRSSGLRRYGKTESGGTDDTRPISFAYDLVYNSGAWTPNGEGASLLPELNANYGPGTVYSQPDATPNSPKGYISTYGVGNNEGHTLGAYLYEPAKSQVLKLHQWYWGQPGSGCLFQIRDGKAEIGLLSLLFNEADLAALNVLWAVDDPSLEQRADIDEKTDLLFDKFESLDFERSTNKSDWYGSYWEVTFIPEDRGFVHIVLEGGDATAIESEAITKTGKEGILWDSTPVNMFSAGGAFWVRTGYPHGVPAAKAEFGPHREGFYYAGSLGDAVFSFNAHTVSGVNSITAEQFFYSNGIDFGFRVNLATTNRRKWPWWYGFSARLNPGVRDAVNDFDDPEWSTDDPYTPADPDAPRLHGNAIEDIEPSFDGVMNTTSYKITVADPNGLFSAGKELPNESIGRLSVDDDPLLTGCLISSIEQMGMRSIKQGTSTIFTAGPDSQLVITAVNGWGILAQYQAKPPPIGDWQHLGFQARAILRTAGFRDEQMTGVSPTDGIIIRGAALGAEWACKGDENTTCADALRGLFESYGYGFRIYQDRFGIWQMKRIDTTPAATFTSSPGAFNPQVTEGRFTLLKPIDLVHDNSNYYNDFICYGGAKGDLVYHMPGTLALLKRYRTKELTNPGLTTKHDVIYACRSMEFMYGRGGVRANYDTLFHRHLEPGNRVFGDERAWEVEGLTGGSWAKDESRFLVFKV